MGFEVCILQHMLSQSREPDPMVAGRLSIGDYKHHATIGSEVMIGVPCHSITSCMIVA